MKLESRLMVMERAVGAGCYDEGGSQCPYTLRFLGQVLSCPSGGCWDGCLRAKEIILNRVALMESRNLHHPDSG
jgi:hypothetical protein